MYNPPAFREDDPGILRGIMRGVRLALLVSAAPDGGVPEATHLPLVLAEEEGPHGTLYGHVAKANPQWRGLAVAGAARAIFTGPEAYVSPSFYPSKQEHGRVVPTWNYIAVQAHGRIRLFDDPDRLLALVSTLTDRHEADRADPWKVADAPESFVRAQLKGIVGFEISVERLEGKRKLSQNRSSADRDGVVAGLAASPEARDREVAAAMGSPVAPVDGARPAP